MCVLYVSFGSKVRPRTFGCVAMNRVQVVLSGFSMKLFCFVIYGVATFTAGYVYLCGVCSPLVVLGLSVRLSWYPM